MAATAVQIPYADASPAELREAILPEDLESFDEQFQAALDAAAQTRRLDKLEAFLEQWRRIARSANHRGHNHWRQVLARADHTLRTGTCRPARRRKSRWLTSSRPGWAGRCTASSLTTRRASRSPAPCQNPSHASDLRFQ